MGDWKLSDRQLGMVRSALSLLLPSERELFLRDFHAALPARPSDEDVHRTLMQTVLGVAQNLTAEVEHEHEHE